MTGVWTKDKAWGSRLGYTHCGTLLPVQTLGRVRMHSKANKKPNEELQGRLKGFPEQMNSCSTIQTPLRVLMEKHIGSQWVEEEGNIQIKHPLPVSRELK